MTRYQGLSAYLTRVALLAVNNKTAMPKLLYKADNEILATLVNIFGYSTTFCTHEDVGHIIVKDLVEVLDQGLKFSKCPQYIRQLQTLKSKLIYTNYKQP